MSPRRSPFPADAETAVTLRRVRVAEDASVRLDGVPWVMLPFDKLRSLSLDHRAGFVLSLIDGRTTIDAILDVVGMPREEALAILERLVGDGVIELR